MRQKPYSDEAKALLRVIEQFRREHGWVPGSVWNPYHAAYEVSNDGSED